MDLSKLTIKKIHQGLVNKNFSALDLAKSYLDNIEKKDEKINSFLSVCKDKALQQAKKVDQKISKGEKIGLLEGVPVSIKDIILIKGMKCTAASKILENYVASYNATCVNKLKNEG